MKWVHQDSLIKVGDTKTITKFLLIPRTLKSSKSNHYETRWLEYATIEYVWTFVSDDGFYWEAVRFVD